MKKNKFEGKNLDERLFKPLIYKEELIAFIKNELPQDINIIIDADKVARKTGRKSVRGYIEKTGDNVYDICLNPLGENKEIDNISLVKNIFHILNDSFSKMEKDATENRDPFTNAKNSSLIINEVSNTFIQDEQVKKLDTVAYKQALLLAVPEVSLNYIDTYYDYSNGYIAEMHDVTAMNMMSRRHLQDELKKDNNKDLGHSA